MPVTIRTRTSKSGDQVLYLDIYFGGKRKRVDLETKDMREARKIAAEVERDLLTNGWGKGRGEALRLEDLIRQYLDYAPTVKAAKTVRTDRESLKALVKVIGNPRLGEITSEHFEHFRAERLQEIKASSVNVALRHMKSIFNWAVDRGTLKASPMAKVRLNRVPKNLHPRFLNEEEVERLRNAVCEDPELLRIINFALWTGMRRNEIINLQWSDIDMDRRTITIQNKIGFQTKSLRSRMVPVNPHLHTMLAGMKSHGIRPDQRVFTASYSAFGKKFLKAVKRAELDGKVSLHTLRHTFASHLVMAGVDLASIQEILGHHDVSVTMIYAHVAPGHLAKTVERLPY